MNRNKKINSKLAVLFTGIYLFAFLFSSNIHNHNGGYFYKDFNFKNSSSKFSQQNAVNNVDDCLSCHFASAPILLPETTKFIFSNRILSESVQVFACSEKIVALHFNYLLRGPPNFI